MDDCIHENIIKKGGEEEIKHAHFMQKQPLIQHLISCYILIPRWWEYFG